MVLGTHTAYSEQALLTPQLTAAVSQALQAMEVETEMERTCFLPPENPKSPGRTDRYPEHATLITGPGEGQRISYSLSGWVGVTAVLLETELGWGAGVW